MKTIYLPLVAGATVLAQVATNLERQTWYSAVDPPGRVVEMQTYPSLDGRMFKKGAGDPYTSPHFWTSLKPFPRDAQGFALSLYFRYSPTSYANCGELSTVQAIEFVILKRLQGITQEWAIQLTNVGTRVNGCEQKPVWRVWTGIGPSDLDYWEEVGEAEVSHSDWHHLTLVGEIVDGMAHYDSYELDWTWHTIDRSFPPRLEDIPVDEVAVAVQLDGNSQGDPWWLEVSEVNVRYWT